MIRGLLFAFWRFMEIITLIPTLGMLGYFVHVYTNANALTPNYILVLFIVSALSSAWTIATLFTYHRTRTNALFVSFIDLCFLGALIAAVYQLRFMVPASCTNVSPGAPYIISFGALGSVDVNGLSVSTDKICAMLKASFVFGIMNCVFFAITSFVALSIGRAYERENVVLKETHYSRHGHRRSGSHRSHRSSNSNRRSAYV